MCKMFAKISLEIRLKIANDLLSRNFCKTKNGLEFGICWVFSFESVNQLGLTKNDDLLHWELGGENGAKVPVSDAGLSSVLKSNCGAPPKSSSNKMAVVRGSIAFATPLYTSTDSRCHRRPIVVATSDEVATAASLPKRLIATTDSG